MLKLEPGEADRLPVPAPRPLHAAADDLLAIKPKVVCYLADGRLGDAVAVVDSVLLTRHLGLAGAELASMRDAQASLAARRAARGVNAARPS